MKATPDDIRKRFEQLADYLSDVDRGQRAIVDAPIALELVARAAAAVTPDAVHVLDVGCGAGNYSLKLLQTLPNVNLTLLDLSASLLERAVQRVGMVATGDVHTVQGDLREVALPEERFDIVLAGAVLHHLREEIEWEVVFSKLYRALRAGGALWISDLVAHDVPAVEGLMRDRYADFLLALGGELARDRVFEEIAEQDSPRSLTFQIDLLRRVGFDAVEVLHKNSCFATFGAFKTART